MFISPDAKFTSALITPFIERALCSTLAAHTAQLISSTGTVAFFISLFAMAEVSFLILRPPKIMFFELCVPAVIDL